MNFHAMFNQKKTRYVLLDDIIPDFEAERVNIFIDLRTVFSHFFSERFEDDVILSDFKFTDIISEIINFAGHYCGYFIKNQLPLEYLSCYILYTDKIDKTKQALFPEYKKSFDRRRHSSESVISRFNKKFTECLSALPDVLTYIPSIFFINTEYKDTYDVVRGFIRKPRPDVMNIILSNDVQYIPFVSKKFNTAVLTMRGTNSIFVQSSNVYRYLCELNTKGSSFDAKNCPLNEAHLLPLLAMVGNPKNDVNGVGRVGFSSGVKRLTSLVNAGLIPRKSYLLLDDYVKLIDAYPAEFDLPSPKKEIFIRNWKLFTTRNEEVTFLPQEKSFIENQLLSKEGSFTSYKEMNHTTFRNNPLDVDFMFDYDSRY